MEYSHRTLQCFRVFHSVFDLALFQQPANKYHWVEFRIHVKERKSTETFVNTLQILILKIMYWLLCILYKFIYSPENYQDLYSQIITV